MILKVRTHPIEVFYLTGNAANQAREDGDSEGTGPCFTTGSYGQDGFCWNTPEEFEADYQMSFGRLVDVETTAKMLAALKAAHHNLTAPQSELKGYDEEAAAAIIAEVEGTKQSSDSADASDRLLATPAASTTGGVSTGKYLSHDHQAKLSEQEKMQERIDNGLRFWDKPGRAVYDLDDVVRVLKALATNRHARDMVAADLVSDGISDRNVIDGALAWAEKLQRDEENRP